MSKNIESVLQEKRSFGSPEEFQAKARFRDLNEFYKLYRESIDQPESFWGRVASDLHWFKKWDRVMDWKLPDLKCFEGGETNIAYNCLDFQIEKGRGDKIALIGETEKGEVQKLSYKDLSHRVKSLAALLLEHGIQKGDRIAIYLPMRVEAVISMLACAYIGATHSVVFGGFSPQALRDRIQDAKAKALISADGGFRRDKWLDLKTAADEAIRGCDSIEKAFFFQFGKDKISFDDPRSVDLSSALQEKRDLPGPTSLPSEHPLFILYTSGSTGKPKGIFHTTGGYMVGTYLSTQSVFDLQENDVYWCTADVGWVTGHSYITYGPLLNGATCVVYEGAPDTPTPSRFWEIVDRHRVSIFYTAPTAIRALIKCGDEFLQSTSRDSLRLLGTVGEPINPEAWMWYREKIGKSRCPIVDTWWQTETGSIMISTLPGVHATKPGSAGVPLFGVDAEIVDQKGNKVPDGEGGLLSIKSPWPSMLRGIYKDPQRYKEEYWTRLPGRYFAGDGAKKDKDGYFWIMGRVDDVVNVSGHRLGTMEIESALVSHPAIAEAAVVSRPDEIKGEAIVAFVTLEQSQTNSVELEKSILEHVTKEIGAIARPSEIRFTASLPKTRSGKIMRRLLRSIASGDESNQDMSTLEDQAALEALRKEG